MPCLETRAKGCVTERPVALATLVPVVPGPPLEMSRLLCCNAHRLLILVQAQASLLSFYSKGGSFRCDRYAAIFTSSSDIADHDLSKLSSASSDVARVVCWSHKVRASMPQNPVGFAHSRAGEPFPCWNVAKRYHHLWVDKL